jgi:hypothetical protein
VAVIGGNPFALNVGFKAGFAGSQCAFLLRLRAANGARKIQRQTRHLPLLMPGGAAMMVNFIHFNPIRAWSERMRKSAELTINYDAKSNPVSAQCSLCGKKMPSADLNAPSESLIAWFVSFFDPHCTDEHLQP